MSSIVLVPTMATVLLIFAGSLFFRSSILGFGVALINLLSLAALSTVIGITVGRQFADVTLLIVSASILIAVIVRELRISSRIPLALLIQTGAFSFLIFASQFVSRQFGLSSVAFTDGHTILSLSQNFQSGGVDLLEGVMSLKRGFALPALHSFGFENEYLVGFMPLFFLAALLMTYYLMLKMTQYKKSALLAFSVLLAICLSTEAILRHAYLINTHSIAWLLVATLSIALVLHFRKENQQNQLILVLSCFIAIGFLRVDYILLFLPFIIVAILTSAARNRLVAFAMALAVGVPAWLWLTFATKDFPFFGGMGPTVILATGLLLAGILIQIQSKLTKPIELLKGKALFIVSALFVTLTLAYANTGASIKAIAINLFWSEGLWGFSAFFLLVIYSLSLFFRVSSKKAPEFGALARLASASVAIYVFTKYLDGVGAGQTYASFARVGFGDSLNRTLVTWIPIFMLPLVRIAMSVLPGDAPVPVSTNGKNKIRSKKGN